MRHAIAIAKRELRSYFVSPTAYAAVTIYALLSGFFFSNQLTYYIRQASLADQQIGGAGRSVLQLDVPTTVLEEFCLEYYGSSPSIPPQIVVPRDAGDLDALEQFLSERRGARVEVRAAERGEKRRLQELATENEIGRAHV